jgi:hypothetical protein
MASYWVSWLRLVLISHSHLVLHYLTSVVLSARLDNPRINQLPQLLKRKLKYSYYSLLYYDTAWFGRQYVRHVFKLVVLGTGYGVWDEVASCTYILCNIETSFNSHLHVWYLYTLKMEASVLLLCWLTFLTDLTLENQIVVSANLT